MTCKFNTTATQISGIMSFSRSSRLGNKVYLIEYWSVSLARQSPSSSHTVAAAEGPEATMRSCREELWTLSCLTRQQQQ